VVLDHKRALSQATFILRPTLSAQAGESSIKQITSLLKQHGITVDKVESWGLKTLSNGKKGWMVLIKFKGSADFHKIKFGPDVVSYTVT